jgi:hypothetical protein
LSERLETVRKRVERYLRADDDAGLAESRLWPALAVVTAASLYATLPVRFIVGSGGFLSAVRWLVPAAAVVLLAPLVLSAPRRRMAVSVERRTAALALVAVISAANAASIVLLVHYIVGGRTINGHELVIAAIHIWCTNVLVFALWFWQLDAGGPAARRLNPHGKRDFLFPQMTTDVAADADWRPGFLDYLYVSYTNATAFSPTDTMPLTQWAKMLMLVESAASLLTLLMVAARAVNILS